MDSLPAVDECRRRLHRAGWSVGEFAAVDTEGRQTWHVSGRNGENAVEAAGDIQAEARAVAASRKTLNPPSVADSSF
jgi:hypothetical protein